MEVDDNVDWHFDKIVGAEFVQGGNGGIDINVAAEVVCGDGEGVKLTVWYEFCSWDGINVGKCVKETKCEFILGVDVSVGWVADRCVWSGVDSTDGIPFEIDQGCDMGYYYVFFDGFNGKEVGLLIYE